MNANDAILSATSTDPRFDASRVIRAPRGSQLTCKNWLIEAAYRMIQNNLDAEVAETARALGLIDRGRIAPGLRADLCLWQADHPAELAYRIGSTPLHTRIFGGRPDV